MELYNKIIDIVDANLIYCLIPIILTLILVELFFKNSFETKKVLNLIRWFIIFYTVITWVFYLIGMALNPEEYAFINRATGPYKFAYWLMFLSALILPFTLLIKKLASKFWYVLLVAFLIKSGFYFERFVIIVTSYHRDYLPKNNTTNSMGIFSYGIVLIFLQGTILAILTLVIFEIIKKNKIVHNKDS